MGYSWISPSGGGAGVLATF